MVGEGEVRGVGLTIITVLLISMLSIPMLQVVELYSLREEILRTDVEMRIGMMDLEVLKRVLISDMLCKLDLHLSKGTLYPLSASPDEIVMPAIRSWASSVRIASNLFDEHFKLSVNSGIEGKLVFDGGGYPITLNVKIWLVGSKSVVSIDDTLSVRHTARIEETKGKALYYKDILLKMIREAARKNETLSFEYERMEDGMEVYAEARGGPEVYRYEVVVKDRGKGAVLDPRLDYGFSANGVIRNQPPD